MEEALTVAMMVVGTMVAHSVVQVAAAMGEAETVEATEAAKEEVGREVG